MVSEMRIYPWKTLHYLFTFLCVLILIKTEINLLNKKGIRQPMASFAIKLILVASLAQSTFSIPASLGAISSDAYVCEVVLCITNC